MILHFPGKIYATFNARDIMLLQEHTYKGKIMWWGGEGPQNRHELWAE